MNHSQYRRISQAVADGIDHVHRTPDTGRHLALNDATEAILRTVYEEIAGDSGSGDWSLDDIRLFLTIR